MKRWAEFDPDRRFRYLLGREWAPERPTALVIGTNPSDADELRDDPTVRREIGFVDRWGFGRYLKVNVFGLVSTDPKRLTQVPDPVGPENDAWIKRAAAEAALIVCAWGVPGALFGRDKAVTAILAGYPLKCLGRNRDGSPKHPLYLRSDTKLEDWRVA